MATMPDNDTKNVMTDGPTDEIMHRCMNVTRSTWTGDHDDQDEMGLLRKSDHLHVFSPHETIPNVRTDIKLE